jgi:hypothetical protein
MANYAVIKDNFVSNIIVAETKEIAETFSGETCVLIEEAVDVTIGSPYIKKSNTFVKPQPHLSWSLNKDLVWQAPIAMPDDGIVYTWDEENQAWIDPVVFAEPMPDDGKKYKLVNNTWVPFNPVTGEEIVSVPTKASDPITIEYPE